MTLSLTYDSSGTEDLSQVTTQQPGADSLVRRVFRAISLSVSGVVLVAVLLIAVVALVIPAVSGSQTYTVATRSMEPAYPPGTFLVVKPTDDLRVGDVITYQLVSGQPEVVTHRIESVAVSSSGERAYITRGDANATADPAPVRPIQVRGALLYAVPLLGWATGLRSGEASSIWIPILAGLLFVYSAVSVVRWFIERRRRHQPERNLDQS